MEKVKKYIIDNKELMKEWDWEKNKDLDPKTLNIGSHKKAWWICKTCGGEWQTQIYLRQKCGCPYCNKGKLLEGFNDLQTINPTLAKEWHPIKNGVLTPNKITANNGKKVWWLGKCGHEWESVVSARNKGGGCPYCSNEKLLKGFNDFATKYPELLKEWDYEDNDILPDEIFSGSHKKVWWTCKICGHTWKTKIDSRTRLQSGCPKCGRKKVEESRYIKVRCVETYKIYNSLVEAEKNTGINRICIGNCCKGKQKTAGKYHWIYENNKEG